MSKSYEEISKHNVNSSGKTDANLANDSLHLGGIPADDYATKKWVKNYHDNKETSLKEYIDKQDNMKLQEAKDYADTIVRGQDFSDFAKITDVQVLDDKLSTKIEQGLIEQKNYTDSKVSQLASDVNQNFETINNSITNINNNVGGLDGKYDKLFQSVSDGKKKVAEAITDKGISTSATATFDTMANNIISIETGGSGGIDTSDATATASDISIGKTAYVNGEKITGTNIVITYSGTDTKGTTATAGDILAGKTAYSNGQFLTGTLQNNNIEEIYSLADESYKLTSISKLDSFKVDNETYTILDDVLLGEVYCVSPSGNLIVRAVKDSSGNQYITSNAMSDTDIYMSMTQGAEDTNPTYKKWRYSFEELGLNPELSIRQISIGTLGFNGEENSAALCIIQATSNSPYTYEIHCYRYSLIDNGYIGYNYETNKIWHWKRAGSTGYTWATPMVCSNNNPYVFVVARTYYGGSNGILSFLKLRNWCEENTTTGVIEISSTSSITNNYFHRTETCGFSTNDNYVYANGNTSSTFTLVAIQKSENGEYYFTTNIYKGSSSIAEILPNETQALYNGYLYDISNNGTKLELINKSEIQYLKKGSLYIRFSPDEKYCLLICHYDKSIIIYEVDKQATAEWKVLQEIPLTGDDTILWRTPGKFQISKDISCGTIGAKTDGLYKFKKNIDKTKITGIKYAGKTFLLGVPE